MRRGAATKIVRLANEAGKHSFLLAACLFSVAPVLWIASIALRPESETYTTPVLILPRTLTLENFRLVIGELPQLRQFVWNSLGITGITVAGVMVITSLAGYAFSRLRFPGRDYLFWLLLISMFMPTSMFLPVVYQMISRLRLLDTWAALFLPYIGWHLALNTFIMRSAFLSIPKELEEAAIVDGCSRFMVFWRILLPLAASAAVTVGIFTFVPVWGEYLYAYTFTSTPKAMPLAVGIRLLAPGPGTGEWTFNVAACAALIAFIPSILIYVGFQRWFTKGLMEGALKF